MLKFAKKTIKSLLWQHPYFRNLEVRAAELAAFGARLETVEASNRFLLHEVRRINEERRLEAFGGLEELETLARQTRESFDYQWAEFNEGVAMPSDEEWMRDIEARICQFTALPREWFQGKRVADIGCGAGRWTYGMLKMGAQVTSFDQSEAALRRTSELARPFADRHQTRQINLLTADDKADFDLVFCFGVVHHTGNTYLAMRNTARKVAKGGRLFLMVYGFPEEKDDYNIISQYAELRQKWRLLTLDERKQAVIDEFGAYLGHGWFDQVSPQVNDLLTFEDIADFLGKLGFDRARRTIKHANHHVVADRIT